ncbi:pyruvoyl-dependent arginine decarboxylase [Candidatus Woesearchaeota archaeon]|nr:pyruvoyl-dependent arginine decarboxylase [Candidatus Woesearchaeota archaeon]
MNTTGESPTDQTAPLIGNRIPHEFFIAAGAGESDITVHAGSYHLALRDAGIEMCNIISYSSILPGTAVETARPARLVHGSVMETIMAAASCRKGERATAGIIFGWLHDRESGDRYGGLVCEYNGPLAKEEAEAQLRLSIQELYGNGYAERFEIRDSRVLLRTVVPGKEFGTAIVALCFTSYRYPVIRDH